MTKKLRYTLLSFFISIMVVLSAMLISPSFKANANSHANCNSSGMYCLVCDVAGKINTLPNTQDINIDNAISVIQQINDIDRIKFALSDNEFTELVSLVDTYSNGVDNFVITKYQNAIDVVRELTGVNLAISKSFNLNGESVSDTSNTQVSFEIINLSSNQTSVLTLFDLASTSAFGSEYYSVTSDGWVFAYKLPKGQYRIKEINLNRPININGENAYFYCDTITVNNATESGEDATDGIIIDLQDNTKVDFLNTRCGNQFAVANDDDNTISGSCNSCGEQYCYQLLAPTGTLVSDGVTEFNTATFTRTCNSPYHFDSAEVGYDEPTITYEYKATISDAFAPAVDFTQEGIYKATLTVQTTYSDFLSVSVEYVVESAPLINEGGTSGSIPEPTPEPTPEPEPQPQPDAQPEEPTEKDMTLIYSVGATTALVSIAGGIIILGTVMMYKKED